MTIASVLLLLDMSSCFYSIELDLPFIINHTSYRAKLENQLHLLFTFPIQCLYSFSSRL